ncbi:MAG: hypothetical protein E7473_11240 [Ruminococcaceae bacterium]|nr:hypothetical protein [Oscillospiraceae bacterium]
MKNFLLTFLLNLIFSAELLISVAIAYLLHIFFSLTVVVTYVLLGLWVGLALLVTAGFGISCNETYPTRHMKNVNPYSKRTQDYLSGFEKNSSGTDSKTSE